MNIEHKKYPKIPQFRDVAYEVKRQSSFSGLDENDEPIYNSGSLLPEIEFNGTVKLHGTNAGVQFGESGAIAYQSRNRIITQEDDNAGFANWMHERVGIVHDSLVEAGMPTENTTVYGEFCGKSIQAGVAISEVEKFFVVFGVKHGDEWLDMELLQMQHEARLYTSRDFDQYKITIDFEKPEAAINEIYELTQAVEAECPVGRLMGVSGIGEGIVWSASSDAHGGSTLRFKSKGDKHSNSKVKTHKPVDTEKADAIRSLAESLMTGERLNQGFEFLAEMNVEPTMQGLGAYLGHVVRDCIAEEKLAISESGIEEKLIGKSLMGIAKRHYMNSQGSPVPI